MRLRAAVVVLVAIAMATACADDPDGDPARPTTPATIGTPDAASNNPLCSQLDVGDPIGVPSDDPAASPVPSCTLPGDATSAIATFDCADGRLHVMFTDEDDRMLEGFVGEGETWRSAQWREEAGRTQLQIDCGG